MKTQIKISSSWKFFLQVMAAIAAFFLALPWVLGGLMQYTGWVRHIVMGF